MVKHYSGKSISLQITQAIVLAMNPDKFDSYQYIFKMNHQDLWELQYYLNMHGLSLSPRCYTNNNLVYWGVYEGLNLGLELKDNYEKTDKFNTAIRILSVEDIFSREAINEPQPSLEWIFYSPDNSYLSYQRSIKIEISISNYSL